MEALSIAGTIPAEQVQETLRQAVYSKVKDAIGKKIDDLVEAEIQRVVETVTAEQVREIVEAKLAEGWQETNRYGEPTGARVSVEEFVLAILTGKRDSYDRDTWLEKQVKEAVTGQFAKDIEVARKQFRAALQQELGQKMATVLADAVGMREIAKPF